MANEYEGIIFWIYVPNKAAAILFTTLFLATTIAHYWQLRKYKSGKLTGLLVAAGFLSVAGFALRVNGAYGNYDMLIPFVLSVAFIYVSPPILLLVNYDILGRLFYYVPYLSPIPPVRVFAIFGLLSLLIESINGVAASLIANPTSNPTLGQGLMFTSLAIQIVTIISAICLTGLFHNRCYQNGLAKARGVREILLTLYVSVFFMLVRTVYRAVEHAITVVNETEWPFYVFEASIMFLNMLLWNVRHPRMYLPLDKRTYLARDGITEITGPEWVDNRAKWVQRVDVLHLRSLCAPVDTSRNKIYEASGSGTYEVRFLELA